jgi:hypothetical protein
MWYMLEGDDLLLSTPQGSRKHRHLLRDARLSVCVEDGFRYLTLIGRATLEEEPAAALAHYRTIGARYMAGRQPAVPPARPDPKTTELLGRERVSVRVRIERVYGQGVAHG